MVVLSQRNLVVALVLLVAMAGGLTGCLPDRYTDAQLTARIAAAQDAAGADTSDGITTGCGNGKLEGTEQCDDEQAGLCSACVQCERRRVLDVKDNSGLVLLDNTENIQLAAKDGLSVEFWVRPTSLPQNGQFTALATLTQIPAGPTTPALVVGYVHDATKNAAYPSCFYLVGSEGPTAIRAVVQAAEPGKVASWQHLRCAYVASDKRLHLSANGQPASQSTQTITKLGKFLEDKTKLVFGAFEANSDGPAFRGQLDELRVVTGAPAANLTSLAQRYVGNEPGTQLLYHMDEADGARTLLDSSGNQLHAVQIQFSPGLQLRSADLQFATEGCYGFAPAATQCKAGSGLPPWCPAQ